jgi:hypothetical protein
MLLLLSEEVQEKEEICEWTHKVQNSNVVNEASTQKQKDVQWQIFIIFGKTLCILKLKHKKKSRHKNFGIKIWFSCFDIYIEHRLLQSSKCHAPIGSEILKNHELWKFVQYSWSFASFLQNFSMSFRIPIIEPLLILLKITEKGVTRLQ